MPTGRMTCRVEACMVTPRAVPGRDPVLDEEVGVLEVAEDAEVDGEGDPQPPFLPRFVRRLFNADADEEVDDGGEGNQPEEAPVPPAVEDVRRNEQQQVLRLEVALGDKPIQPKDNRQKEQKLRAVEEHLDSNDVQSIAKKTQ